MATLLIILQLLPVLLKLIPLIEETIKLLTSGTSGLGPIKKQIIMDSVTISGINDKTVVVISKLIDLSVSNLNKVGLSVKESFALKETK